MNPQLARPRRRRPLPNETMIPLGWEAVAHPVFMVLRREIPLPADGDQDGGKRHVAFGEPWEATDEALSSAARGKQERWAKGARAVDTSAAAAATVAVGDGAEAEEEEADLDCSICQEEMKDPVTCCVQKCTHSYCRDCIKRWLAISRRCPLCQQGVTWLLGFSSASSSAAGANPPADSPTSLRYTLLAVGPDQAELERQPFPAPALLQEARAKQLKLHRTMERRRRREDCEQQKEDKSESRRQREKKEEEREKREWRKRKETGTEGRDGKKRSAAAVLEDELARLNRQIERESRKLQQPNRATNV